MIAKWSLSTAGRQAGWQPIENAFDRLGTVYGRTIIFRSGKLSEEPFMFPATPLGTETALWAAYFPRFDSSTPFFLPHEKIVAQPHHPTSANPVDSPVGAKPLRLGEKDGAVLLGEIVTKPACLGNIRLRLVKSQSGLEVRTFIGYALIDGSGIRRKAGIMETDAGYLSPYLRPLECQSHQPRVLQHDLLLMPTPLPWPPIAFRTKGHPAHEEWCLDDWFPAQPDACWVIRETELSSPLMERFELMPASQESNLSVFFIALFAETEPARLVMELSALHGVSPQPILDSPETMQNLMTLYQRIQQFRWE